MKQNAHTILVLRQILKQIPQLDSTPTNYDLLQAMPDMKTLSEKLAFARRIENAVEVLEHVYLMIPGSSIIKEQLSPSKPGMPFNKRTEKRRLGFWASCLRDMCEYAESWRPMLNRKDVQDDARFKEMIETAMRATGILGEIEWNIASLGYMDFIENKKAPLIKWRSAEPFMNNSMMPQRFEDAEAHQELRKVS